MKTLVIFGAGKQGNIWYYTLSQYYEILFFVDNRISMEETGECLGLPVYHPNYLMTDKSWDCILISSLLYTGEIGKQLYEMGFRYGTDFLTAYDMQFHTNAMDAFLYRIWEPQLFAQQIENLLDGREPAFIYGNCQTEVIASLLEGNSDFCRRYLLIRIPPLFYEECIDTIRFVMESGIWGKCGLFITQIVKEDNRFSRELSTNYLISRLPEQCRIIRIPDLYFRGYWPDAYELSHNERVLKQYYGSTGLFANGYKIIDKLIKEKHPIQDILTIIQDPGLYTEDFIRTKIEGEINRFEDKEVRQNLDVTMTDYLRRYYDKELLFHCFHHPSIKLLAEVSRRICSRLGIKGRIWEDYNQNFHMDNYGMLLYPSTINGLKFENSYLSMLYYPYSGLQNGITFEEYVNRYVNYRLRTGISGDAG